MASLSVFRSFLFLVKVFVPFMFDSIFLLSPGDSSPHIVNFSMYGSIMR